MKNCISFLLCFLASQLLFANTAENMGGWILFSPIPGESTVQTHVYPRSLADLKKLGNQAQKAFEAGKTTEDRAERLQEIFKGADSSSLSIIINQILSDDSLLEKVTAASYYNATGFLKIVLTTGGVEKSWKIRLHMWQKNQKEHPHSHKWSFYSKIMSGYLTQTVYELARPLAQGAKPYRLAEPVSSMPRLPTGEEACPCRDNYTLVFKDELDPLTKEQSSSAAYMRVASEEIIGVNESYFMPHYLPHTIAPGRRSLSLVFTTDRQEDNSEVYIAVDEQEKSRKKYASSVNKEELREELIKVLKILNGQSVVSLYLPEVVDPEHRYFDKKEENFKVLKKNRWRAFLPAFETRSRVVQLNSTQREKYLVTVKNNELLVDEKAPRKQKEYLFVLFDGKMFAAPKGFFHEDKNLLCHTSFTDYSNVDAAGLLIFDKNGNLIVVEAYSGHYQPTLEAMRCVVEHLAGLGLNTELVKIQNFRDR